MYNFDWVQLSATCRKQTNASNHIVTSFIVGFMKGFKQVRRARSAVKILPKPRPDGTTVRNEVLDISTYSHDHYWKTSDRTIPNVQQNCRSTSNRNHPYIKVSEISRCLNLHHWYSLTIWWFQPESSPSRGEHNKYLKPPARIMATSICPTTDLRKQLGTPPLGPSAMRWTELVLLEANLQVWEPIQEVLGPQQFIEVFRCLPLRKWKNIAVSK